LDILCLQSLHVINVSFQLIILQLGYPGTQAAEIYNHASFVDAYEMQDKMIALYSYSDFYIEVPTALVELCSTSLSS